MLVKLVKDEVEGLQTDKHQESSSRSKNVHSSSACQSDGCRNPQTGCRSQSAHGILILLEDNSACTDETDTRDHLGSNTRHVPAVLCSRQRTFEAVGRDDHKECRAKCHEEMGTEPCLLGTIFTFETDGTTQQGCHKDAYYEFQCNIIHTIVVLNFVGKGTANRAKRQTLCTKNREILGCFANYSYFCDIMQRIRQLLTLIALALSIAIGSKAQEALLTERYNVSYLDLGNGLPHNNVSAIFVDSNGFLWIGTYGGGLVRYDGYSMMSPIVKLNSNSCKSITEDRFKRLWVAYDEGTNVIDLKTMSGATALQLPEQYEGLLSEPSTKVQCDALGRIWLVTNSHVNLITFDNEGDIVRISSYQYHENTPDISIRDIEGNGKPWIGIDGGLYRLVEKNGILTKEEISPLFNELRGLYFTDMLKRDNMVWITTNHALFRYDPYQRRLDRYVHSDAPGALSHEFLSSLSLTQDNVLLVGSLYGVNMYDDKTDSFTAWNSASPSPLRSDFIHCILVDKGLIWVGTESGGIARLVPRQLMLQNYVHSSLQSSSISPNPVNAMYAEANGTLWVGTVEGGLNRKAVGETGFTHFTTDNSSLPHNSVSALASDGKGTLWIGTWGGGLSMMNLASQNIQRFELPVDQALLTKFVGALAYDQRNNGLWIGSNDGVFFYDLATRQLQIPLDISHLVRGCIGSMIDRNGRLWMGCMQGMVIIDLKSRKDGKFNFRDLRYQLDNPDSKIYDKISSFCESKDGSMWIGSNGYGLYHRTVGKDGKEHFEAFRQEDGLVNNAVKGITEDRNGRLWITTLNGLSVYDPKTKTFTNYSQHDGLASPHFYFNSAITSAQGLIYLGSEAGLIEVSGENVDADSHRHLVFTHLMVDNQDAIAGSDYLAEDISIAKKISLSESNRSFSIDFSALNYGYEAQGNFRYRMKGFDNDWTLLKPGQHSVRYSALPAGSYVFEVKYESAVAPEGSDTISIDVVVKPYFWRSWWFRLLMGILFVALLIYIYNRWVAVVKRREAEQLLSPIRQVMEESEDPRQLQARIRTILDNQQRYRHSVEKSMEVDKEEMAKTQKPFMERVMEIMEANYSNSDFGVQEFCDALGMSRSVASKHLNSEVGVPAGQFIRNYRLNMAKEMLSAKTGNRNITEVAYAVGFNDPKYFTRCFTKMFGKNPSTF